MVRKTSQLRGGTNGGFRVTEAASGDADAASGPNSAGATSAVLGVSTPGGNFTTGWDVVCACLLQGCGMKRSPDVKMRHAVTDTAMISTGTIHRASVSDARSNMRQV